METIAVESFKPLAVKTNIKAPMPMMENKMAPVVDDVSDGWVDDEPHTMGGSIPTEQFLTEDQMLGRNLNAMKSSNQQSSGIPQNIANSKIPTSILESFKNKPPMIPNIDPTKPPGMDNFMHKLASKIKPIKEVIQASEPNYQPSAQPSSGLNIEMVEYIIKTTVEKIFEEMEKKNKTIDENIQIKIGGKTFGGKIKTLKESK